MIGLYWGSALHPATEILDDSQKLSAVQKQCTQGQQGLGPAVLSYKSRPVCKKCFDKQYG